MNMEEEETSDDSGKCGPWACSVWPGLAPYWPVPFGDGGEPWEWQCEGCTNSWKMGDAADAAYLNAKGITFAILGEGPYEEIAAFRDFMGYTAVVLQ